MKDNPTSDKKNRDCQNIELNDRPCVECVRTGLLTEYFPFPAKHLQFAPREINNTKTTANTMLENIWEYKNALPALTSIYTNSTSDLARPKFQTGAKSKIYFISSID